MARPGGVARLDRQQREDGGGERAVVETRCLSGEERDREVLHRDGRPGERRLVLGHPVEVEERLGHGAASEHALEDAHVGELVGAERVRPQLLRPAHAADGADAYGREVERRLQVLEDEVVVEDVAVAARRGALRRRRGEPRRKRRAAQCRSAQERGARRAVEAVERLGDRAVRVDGVQG
jgi:hypothetical protein